MLVDRARRRRTRNKGKREVLDDLVDELQQEHIDLIDLDSALQRLAAFDEKLVRLVELRFFGDLTVQETAKVMGRSKRSIEREWELAKSWLKRELS